MIKWYSLLLSLLIFGYSCQPTTQEDNNNEVKIFEFVKYSYGPKQLTKDQMEFKHNTILESNRSLNILLYLDKIPDGEHKCELILKNISQDTINFRTIKNTGGPLYMLWPDPMQVAPGGSCTIKGEMSVLPERRGFTKRTNLEITHQNHQNRRVTLFTYLDSKHTLK